jgi:hypothetical protein
MTNRNREARVLRATSFLAFAALACGCDTGGDSQGAASGNVEGKAEASAEAKAGVSVGKPARTESAEVRLDARPASGQAQADVAASPAQAQLKAETPPAPGQAQLNLAAVQLAEASARLSAVAKGASVEASADPTTPSLKVSKDGNTVVDAKVQAGNPSLNLGKAGTLIDANVAAGNPSLNIGGLKPPANTSASAGTPANTK